MYAKLEKCFRVMFAWCNTINKIFGQYVLNHQFIEHVLILQFLKSILRSDAVEPTTWSVQVTSTILRQNKFLKVFVRKNKLRQFKLI